MKVVLILFSMIFLHIVDDYYLQGILAKMKQKSWWEENAPQEQYKHDYKVALIMHAFSWSFMIMIPYLFIGINEYVACGAVLVNATIHAIIDDLKANKKMINLVQDQTAHILQVFVTWLVAGLLGG
jgi:hypothetical protein